MLWSMPLSRHWTTRSLLRHWSVPTSPSFGSSCVDNPPYASRRLAVRPVGIPFAAATAGELPGDPPCQPPSFPPSFISTRFVPSLFRGWGRTPEISCRYPIASCRASFVYRSAVPPHPVSPATTSSPQGLQLNVSLSLEPLHRARAARTQVSIGSLHFFSSIETVTHR